MENYGISQSSSGHLDLPDPRRKGMMVALLALAIALILFGTLVAFFPTVIGFKNSYSMKDLQNDFRFIERPYSIAGYEFLPGDFASFKPGDSVLFRDNVTRVELTGHNVGPGSVTELFFSAYLLPTPDMIQNDLKAKLSNGSWYVCFTSPYGRSTVESPFPISQGSYEASISVEGDLSQIIHAGDTVEIALHVYNKLGLNSSAIDENINEFRLITPSNNVNVVSSTPANDYMINGISLAVFGTLCLMLALGLGAKKDHRLTLIGAMAMLIISLSIGAILQIAFDRFGGPALRNFFVETGKLLTIVFGGWWLRGFGVILGSAMALVSLFAVFDMDAMSGKGRPTDEWDRTRDWIRIWGFTALLVFLSFSLTAFLSSMAWSALGPFISDFTPVWNIFTLTFFLGGIIIPLYICWRSTLFFGKIAHRILSWRGRRCLEIKNANELRRQK